MITCSFSLGLINTFHRASHSRTAPPASPLGSCILAVSLHLTAQQWHICSHFGSSCHSPQLCYRGGSENPMIQNSSSWEKLVDCFFLASFSLTREDLWSQFAAFFFCLKNGVLNGLKWTKRVVLVSGFLYLQFSGLFMSQFILSRPLMQSVGSSFIRNQLFQLCTVHTSTMDSRSSPKTK